jgi:hypothetical protein
MIQFDNIKEMNQYIAQYAKRIEKALIYSLEYMVADLQNHAKLNGAYNDVTSNLRSSIGGLVLKDGKTIHSAGFEGSGVGISTGRAYADQIANQLGGGYVALVVAGMEYGTYVEHVVGKNVLKLTELKMYSDMPKILENLKNKIDANYK